jgi:hypothetical protein
MVNDLLKILFLVLIVAIDQFELFVAFNEMDVLPAAYAVFDSEWLANDWYLSLRIPYRDLFGWIVGAFIFKLGFVKTIFLGRLISYFLFSFAFISLLKTLKIDFKLGCIALILFLTFFSATFHGEWIIGGLETKVFAYTCVLLSINFFLTTRVGLCLLFSGLALSFHLLIGGFHLFCLAFLFAIQFLNDRSIIRKFIYHVPIFILGGAWGLYGIYDHLNLSLNSDIAISGWDIYVNLRVPYHVLPQLGFLPIAFPILIAVFHFVNIRFGNDNDHKALSVYSLSTCIIAMSGLVVYLFGETSLLRYYFFRFGDVIQPLTALLIVTSLLSQYCERTWYLKRVRIAFALAFLIFLGSNYSQIKVLADYSRYSEQAMLEHSAVDLELNRWIKNHVEKEAVLIQPLNMINFYMEAERAMFVSWKHSPQSSGDILEWYRRLKLMNRNIDFDEEENPVRTIEFNYQNLSEDEIINIQKVYPEITHIIMSRENSLSFPVLFETKLHVLYKL